MVPRRAPWWWKGTFKTSFLYPEQAPGGSARKNPPATHETMGSIPRMGRSPRGGHGNPLQYSCLENPMDRGAWWATVHSHKHIQWRVQPFVFNSKNVIPACRNTLSIYDHKTCLQNQSLHTRFWSLSPCSSSFWLSTCPALPNPNFLPKSLEHFKTMKKNLISIKRSYSGRKQAAPWSLSPFRSWTP